MGIKVLEAFLSRRLEVRETLRSIIRVRQAPEVEKKEGEDGVFDETIEDESAAEVEEGAGVDSGDDAVEEVEVEKAGAVVEVGEVEKADAAFGEEVGREGQLEVAVGGVRQEGASDEAVAGTDVVEEEDVVLGEEEQIPRLRPNEDIVVTL